MESKALILVTYAKQYSIDENTRGTSVNYYFLDENGGFLRQDEDGQQNAKVSMSYDDRSNFPVVPAVYEGGFTMTIGSDRKPVLKLTSVHFKAPVHIHMEVAKGNSFDKAPDKSVK